MSYFKGSNSFNVPFFISLMACTIPLELYQHIEEKFGKELATEVAKTVESGVLLVEEQAKAFAVQNKKWNE